MLDLDFVRRYYDYLTLFRNPNQYLPSLKHKPSPLNFNRFERMTTYLILNEAINRLSISISRCSENSYRKNLVESKTKKKNSTLSGKSNQFILVKFVKDIESIINILHVTQDEIKTIKIAQTLHDDIIKHYNESIDEYKSIWGYIQNVLIYDMLCEKSRKSKNETKAKIRQLTDDISKIDTQIYDCIIHNQLKYGLVLKWEKTRHEQAKSILENEETNLENAIKLYKNQSQQEQIAIENIEKFLLSKVIDLESLTSFWIEKHAADIIALTNQTKQTNENIAEIKLKINEIRCKYDAQSIFIEEYRKEQKILDEKRKFETKQRNDAIRIQSWWRGVMVRRQLGPYRVKKKGKKGKKK